MKLVYQKQTNISFESMRIYLKHDGCKQKLIIIIGKNINTKPLKQYNLNATN